jgi:hypothetical protein
MIQHVIHLLRTLTYCKSSYRIPGKVKLTDSLGMLDPDIVEYSTLINAEKKLIGIDTILPAA